MVIIAQAENKVKEGGEGMDVKIETVDNLHCVEINGTVIENVKDYKVKTSAQGRTEVTLKFILTDCARSMVATDNSIQSLQLNC